MNFETDVVDKEFRANLRTFLSRRPPEGREVIDMSSNKWVIFPKTNPAASLRLFCFHHAGGIAQAFHGWPKHLPPIVEMAAVQLPGRGHRFNDPYIRRLAPLWKRCKTTSYWN